MKANRLVIIALALSLPAASLFAQNDGPPPGGPNGGPPDGQDGGGRRHRPMMPVIAALDANHDGVISADEIANASAALKKLDKNGDGQLTRDELMPPRPQGGPDGQGGPGPQGRQNGAPPSDDGSKSSGQDHPKRPLPPILAALDTNHDGVISAEEIANAPAALKTLDKNGDGQLTMDEVMGPRPQGRDGQNGPGDGKGPNGGGNGQRPPPAAQDN